MNTQKTGILVAAIVLLFSSSVVYAQDTVFTPVRNDTLAAEFAPAIINNEAFGPLAGVYYRAASDSAGNTYIAYHPVWPYERNETSGCMPLLNRSVYTGGLGLQKKMFGPGDIEVVIVVLDKNKKPVSVKYETAENYNPSGFGVKHKTIEEKDAIAVPLCFKVVSWNHLFSRTDTEAVPAGHKLITSRPQYFEKAYWEYYGMHKQKEGALSKNRAHAVWERVAAE